MLLLTSVQKKGGFNMNKKKHNKVYYIEQRRKKNKVKLKQQKQNTIKESYGYINTSTECINTQQIETIKKTTTKKKSLFKKFKYETLLFSTISSLVLSFNPFTSKAFSQLKNNQVNIEKNEEELDEVLENNNVTIKYEENTSNFDSDYNDYINLFNEQKQQILEEQKKTKELEKQRKEEERVNEYDYYIETYAIYFNLDTNKVLDICHDLYQNYELLDSSFDENKNYFAINFICQLYSNNYIELGYNREDLLIDNSIVTLTDDKSLSNGYTYDDYLTYISRIAGITPELVLAISHYETGYQKSNLAQTKNNFGGITFSNGFATFPTPEAGIVYEVYTIKNIIDNYEIDNLTDLSAVYVNGNINKPSELWEDSVGCIYNDISDGKELTLKSSL